jgi:hypothetical protein
LSGLLPDNHTITADEPEPSWTGKVKAVVTDEPEPSLAGKVKAAAADEPEPSLKGMVKVADGAEAQELEKAHAEEPETAILNSLADEPSPEVEQDEAKAGASLVAEPELPLEGRDEADLDVADVPEASLERAATEDATAADEPEPKASSEEEAMVNVAHTNTPAEPETETSHEEEVMANAEPPLAELIPEVEQGEGTAEPALAEEPETAEHVMLAYEPEKAQCALLAEAPETADAMELAQEPEKAEPFAEEPETVDAMELTQEPEMAAPTNLADEPMFDYLFDEEDEVKDEMDTSEEQEANDQMLVDEGEQVDNEMAEIGDLPPIPEQDRILVEAQTNLYFAQFQRMAEQSRAAEQERAAAQAAQEEDARVEARRRELEEQQAWRDEEDWAVHAGLLARMEAEGEPALPMAGQAAAEPAFAGEAGMLDPALAAALDAALLGFEGGDDEDTSLNGDDLEFLLWGQEEEVEEETSLTEEDLLYLLGEHEFSLGVVEEEQEEGNEVNTATEAGPEAEPQSASAGEVQPTEPAEETCVGQLPTTTPATFNSGRAAHQTTPEAVPPVSEFVFRADTPATAAPTQLPAQAADAEAAPAAEAGPPRADPAVLARRKMLPRRGVRGSTEAKLRMLQEFRESQPAPKEEKVKEEGVEEKAEEEEAKVEEVVEKEVVEEEKVVEQEKEEPAGGLDEEDSFVRQIAENEPELYARWLAEERRAKDKAASEGKDAA